MSVLKTLFDQNPQITTPHAGPGMVTDGSGRYLEASMALRLLLHKIEANPSVSLLLAHDSSGTPSTPSAPTPTPPFMPPVDVEEGEAVAPITLPDPPRSRVIIPADILDDFDEPGDTIPAQSMRPFLDAAVAKVMAMPYFSGVTELKPGESPLGEAYASIEDHALIAFHVILKPSRTSMDQGGIHSHSAHQGGAIPCWGAIVIGEDTPHDSDIPKVSLEAGKGPLLKAEIDRLSDGTPVMLHVAYDVRAITVFRTLPIFRAQVVAKDAELQANHQKNKAAMVGDVQEDGIDMNKLAAAIAALKAQGML